MGEADLQAEAPRTLANVDLFAPGAQEYWYDAYAILHEQAPVQRLPGEGLTPGTDAFVLTKYEDVRRVVMDWDRFPPTLSLLVAHIQASQGADRSVGRPRLHAPCGDDRRPCG